MLARSPAGRSTGAHLILVGGGLANALIAYRLRQVRPEVAVTVLERGPTLGGNHTWSFHETDVPQAALAWLEPFITHRWAGQSVRFADRERRFSTPYGSITSQRLHDVLAASLPQAIHTRRLARRILPTQVETEDGAIFTGSAVVDGRGKPPLEHLVLGWQKFAGLEVRTASPHGLDEPIIMDATVAQVDGYRFVYVLPFGPDRLLIEDTHYSDTPGFSARRYHDEIHAYAARQGWSIAEVLRSEQGALPIALGGDIDGLCGAMADVPRSGLAAGLFHPTTGYSLPDAVRLAERLAREPVLDAQSVARTVRAHVRKTWNARRLYRMLNRMLFRAADPAQRHRVLSHFYRLPQPLVERFYADRLTALDKARILTGKPPVPIPRAIRAILHQPRPAGRLVTEPET
jgi:lycopene beta-cyclase